MKKKLLLVGLCLTALAAPRFTKAQSQHASPCGTNEAMEEYMRQNPDYARQLAEYEQMLRVVSANPELRGRQSVTKVIPVVVHIIHDYSSSNISRAQVLDAIRVLNNDFNKTNADTAQVISVFQPLYANSQIEFRLAQLDPNGNCTEGITRTYSTLTNSAGNTVKDLIRWNPAHYLNVWVVQNIASGAGGYSYLPCVSSSIDGIVVRNAQFGSIGTSPATGLSPRTLTHEVGHYLGLPHTWGGTNTPGLSSNCSTDDGIEDTPNTVGVSNQSCNTNMNSCNTHNNVQNFMDYANCPKMFTLGQKAVMHDALNLPCRASLWNSNNLNVTGTNNGYIASVCRPKVDFNTATRRICEGGTVTFTDLTYNAVADSSWTWRWTFTGGSPSTSSNRYPVVQYTTPGTYSVKLVVTSSAGSDSVSRTAYIDVKSVAVGLQAPSSEGFEATGFPANTTNPLLSWEIINSTSNTWERTGAAAAEGASSMRIRHSFIPLDRENSLVSPTIHLTGLSQPALRFKVAYAVPAGSTNPDRLRVSYSTDCGRNWTVRYSRSGSTLATTSASGGSSFVPTETEWREDVVNLPSNLANLMVKFESLSGNGGTLYIDDVRITGTVTGIEEAAEALAMEVYPNPGHGNATLTYSLPSAGLTRLNITNLIGQVIYKSEKVEQQGDYKHSLIDLAGRVSPGVYYIRLETAGKVAVRKVIIH